MTQDPIDLCEPPWAEIRAAYEGSALAVAAIAEAYGIGESRLRRRARRDRWHPRRPPPGAAPAEAADALDRSVLVGRLFGAVERQIAEIERRFQTTAAGGVDEKDARTLAALARTLELLIGLEKQARRDDDGAAPEADLDEFRRDLARRLEGLRRTP